MKISAVVDFGGLQVFQVWDFIPEDEQMGENAILILISFANGDRVGIPLVASQIKKQDGVGGAAFHYDEVVLTADAELISQAEKLN